MGQIVWRISIHLKLLSHFFNFKHEGSSEIIFSPLKFIFLLPPFIFLPLLFFFLNLPFFLTSGFHQSSNLITWNTLTVSARCMKVIGHSSILFGALTRSGCSGLPSVMDRILFISNGWMSPWNAYYERRSYKMLIINTCIIFKQEKMIITISL